MVKNRNTGKSTRKNKKSTRQIVREEIDKMAETKKELTEIAELAITSYSETASPGGASSGLQIYQLNDIARGNTASTRVGNKIIVSGLGMRGLLHGRGLTIDGNTSQNAVYVRHAILKRKSAEDFSDLTPAETQLFLKASSALAFNDATNVERYILPWNHRDFEILFQRTEKLGIVNTTYSQNYFNNKKVSFYNKLNIPCEWASGSDALTDECNPGIYYVIFCGNMNMDDVSTAGDELSLGACEVNMALTTYFKDL